jgi:hypothetical protein
MAGETKGGSDADVAITLLDDENFDRIHRAIEKIAREMSSGPGVSEDVTRKIVLSIPELGAALNEAKIDLSFVRQRRGLSSPSIGKVAGVLTFRLCRHDIIHLPSELTDNVNFTCFKERVVLAFVVHTLLKMSVLNPWISGQYIDTVATGSINQQKKLANIITELAYMLRRRHYNQEILGVVFDTMRIVNQMSTLVPPGAVPAPAVASTSPALPTA